MYRTVLYLPASCRPHVLNGIFSIPTLHLQRSHLCFDLANLLTPDFFGLLLQLPCLPELVEHELWERLHFTSYIVVIRDDSLMAARCCSLTGFREDEGVQVPGVV